MPRKTAEARQQYEANERPNKEARRKASRKWARENKEYLREYSKKFRARYRRLTKGTKEVLVPETLVEQLWLAQNKCCAICKKEIPLRGFHTHLDHDHETLAIRGLLCSKCNLGLGHFQDNIESCLAAAEYLRKHKR